MGIGGDRQIGVRAGVLLVQELNNAVVFLLLRYEVENRVGLLSFAEEPEQAVVQGGRLAGAGRPEDKTGTGRRNDVLL